jgi:hypothetical protein
VIVVSAYVLVKLFCAGPQESMLYSYGCFLGYACYFSSRIIRYAFAARTLDAPSRNA